MAATTEADRRRIAVENVLACIAGADECLRCALLKLVQWARTDYEADIMARIIEARGEMRKAREITQGLT